MGAWGYESPSNDTTMDILCDACKSIYHPTQTECDAYCSSEKDWDLGATIWFLQHGCKVSADVLRYCEKPIEDELNLPPEEDLWGGARERKKCLEAEKKMIASALEHDGHSKLIYAQPIGDLLSMGLGAVGNSISLLEVK